MSRTVAVILGAGRGVRLKAASGNKVLLPLGGEPLIVRAARAFASHPAIDELIVVVSAEHVGTCERELRGAGIEAAVFPGGPSRHASEWTAIRHVAARIEAGEIDLVVIHDAARPLYRGQRLEELLSAARDSGGAIFGIPVEEDLVWIQEGRPVEPASTGGMWRAQTPQAFQARPLLQAFARAEREGFEGSDTASTVERLGISIRMLEGDPSNIKITYPEDLVRAESLLGDVQSR